MDLMSITAIPLARLYSQIQTRPRELTEIPKCRGAARDVK
jgi:hypothetical protein